MSTEKLYYLDSHLKEFEGIVESCVEYKGKFKVVLNRTAFFPGGGGQSADTGFLNEVPVVDVKEQEDTICHITEVPFEEGMKVQGTINWEERFSKMQQHSGEHIVSGLIHSLWGYDNVGFHLGKETCTLDTSGPLTKEQMELVETMANEAVFRNVPIHILYPTEEELAKMEYRSKIEIEGQVRIVDIPGYDRCACCAPHLSRTGEIGLIKFVQSQNYKGGVRITLVCGNRALADYRLKERNMKSIMASLSAKEELVSEAVAHLLDENNANKELICKVQRELIKYKALEFAGEQYVCVFDDGFDGVMQREYMNAILDSGTHVCAVMRKKEDHLYQYVLGSKEQDVREIGKKMNAAFCGKGGGKPEMVQGTLSGEKEEILEKFKQFCKQ